MGTMPAVASAPGWFVVVSLLCVWCVRMAAATTVGVPDWESVPLVYEKVAETGIRISWQPPNDRGSAVIGYIVLMEADGNGVWETVYDGTNRPGVLSYLATGLHADLEYKFQVLAESRIGRSAPNELTIKLLDLMASPASRVVRYPSEVISDRAYEYELQVVNPLTNQDEVRGGRRFVMSVHDVCELDLTSTICVRVEDGHPLDAEDALGTPKCCIHSQDMGNGRYVFTDVMRIESNYSVAIQAIEPGGLLGQYWDNEWLYGYPVETRQDPDLDFDWGLGVIAQQASDFASARWTGFVMPEYTETYRFYVEADDSARLWVNGDLLFDKFNGSCCQEWWGDAPLVGGELAHIQLEYRERAGFAKMKFQWSSFSQMKSKIPPGKLFKAPFITDSPYIIEVQHGPVNAPQSVAFGDALSNARCLQTFTIHIQAKDAAGNLLQTNGETFIASFNGPSNPSFNSEPVNPLNFDGLYRIDYMLSQAGNYDINIGIFGVPIQGSPFKLVARPGHVSPQHSTTEGLSVPSATAQFTAGTEAEFIVQARDAAGNPSDEDVGGVACALEWLSYDRTTEPDVVDDEELNTAQYGRYFFCDVSYQGDGRFLMRYTALREGSNKLYVTINGLDVDGSPYDVTGLPAAEAFGPKCITEEGAPAATGTAGETYRFQVQLRDAFGNLMSATRTEDEPTVRITATHTPTSSVDEGSCEPRYYGINAVTTSLWQCQVTPTTAGDRLLSIQVAGVEVSKLEPNVSMSSQVAVTYGPFPIYIEPANPYADNTMVYNVQDEYIAGQTVPALVQLRDFYGNNLTSMPSTLSFRAQFGPSELNTRGVNWIDNGDGTITLHVGTFLAVSVKLDIFIYDVDIGNSPIENIPVVPTAAVSTGTSCDIPSTVNSGEDVTFICYPRDVNNNAVDNDGLYIYAEFRNMDNETAPVVRVKGIYNLASDPTGLYDMPLQLTPFGSYSVVARLWEQHGLLAMYYRTPGFAALIPGETDRQHQGEPMLVYTQIDRAINLTWPEAPVDTGAGDYWSARWSGYLLPKETSIYNLRIESDYGVRVTLDETVIIDEIHTQMAVRASAQVVLTHGEPLPILIEYIHNAATGYLRLYWASTIFEEELVPSENLLHPLNVLDGDTTTEVPEIIPPTTTTTTPVMPGPVVAANTLIEGEGASVAVAGVKASFTATLRDANGMHTGTSAAVVVTQSFMTVTYLGQGVYLVEYEVTLAQPFTFGMQVNRQEVFQTQGSHTTVTVNPAPIDPTKGEEYDFARSTLSPPDGLLPANVVHEVEFLARDVENNFVTDTSEIAMICEADGPERSSPPYRLPLDIQASSSIAGRFDLSMLLPPGEYEVDCYVAKRGGLNARYFNNRWVEGDPVTVRVETSINFDWGEGLVSVDASDYVSAQYDAYLRVPELANYTFYITCDDGAKLWLDDELLISMESPGQMETEEVMLTGSRLYHVQVMFYERTGFSQLRLEWSNDEGVSRGVITGDYLYHSRILLADFPRYVHAYSPPGPVEAFYHYDLEADVNRLAWIAPLDDGGKSIDGYKIYRDNGEGGAITDLRGTFGANTFDFMEEFQNEAHKPFRYRIFAHNAEDGEEVTITAQPTTEPDKPRPALLVGGGYDSLTFRFSPYSDGSPQAGYSTIDRYRFYRNEGLGGILRIGYTGELSGSDVDFTVGGLVPGRPYLFQTAYETSVAQSDPSEIAMVVCCEFSPPQGAPTNIRRTGVQTDRIITFTWDEVINVGSASLTHYLVYLDDGVTDELVGDSGTASNRVHSFNFLTGGDIYRISVAAVNAAGVGPRSERVAFVASDEPSEPLNVRVVYQSREKITIAWDRPVSVGNRGMTGYYVFTNDGQGGPVDILAYNGSQQASALSFTWEPRDSEGRTLLIAGAPYSFQVQGINAAGLGFLSTVLEDVLAATKPAAPGRPESDTSQTSTSAVYVTWTAPDDGGSPILGYGVERLETLGGDTWIPLVSNTSDPLQTSTTYVDTYNIDVNERYRYRIWAFNLVTTGDDRISPEATLIAAPPPDPPEVTFVSSNETSISVEWSLPWSVTSPLLVTGFKLFINRAMVYDGTGVPTLRSYTVDHCETGSVMDFAATATTAAGESTLSANLALICARRPYPPPQPRLKSAAQDYIEIEWEAPTDNGGQALTGYIVLRTDHDSFAVGNPVSCLQDDSSHLSQQPREALSCWDDTASTCKDLMCKYRVVAINDIENSNYADASPSLIAIAAGVPDPPTSITRENHPTSATAIEVTWAAVTGTATGGASILGYNLYANTGINDEPVLIFESRTPSVRTWVHKGLIPGRRYWYQATAVNPTGEGPKSDVFIFLAAAPPSAPPQPRLVAALESHITVGFDAPDDDGGSQLTKYVIYFNDGTRIGQLTSTVHICNTSAQEYEVPMPEPGRDYQFQIQAHGECPYGAAAEAPFNGPRDPVCTSTTDCTLPGEMSPVSIFTASGLPYALGIEVVLESATRNTLMFRWTPFDPITDADGGTIIVAYDVYRDDGLGGSFVMVDTLPASYTDPDTQLEVVAQEYTYTGLVTGRQYNFRISACNRRGCTAGSLHGGGFGGVPLAVGSAPDAPAAPWASITSTSLINLTITPMDNGGLPITHYLIERDDGNEGTFASSWWWQGNTIPASNPMFEDPNVTASATYRYRVQAVNERGTSSYSLIATYKAAGVPDKMADPTLVAQTKTSIQLSWATPAQNNGADVTEFVLYRDDGLGSELVPVYKGSALSYNNRGLVTGRFYAFRVAAVNVVGEGPLTDRLLFGAVQMPSTVGAPVLRESGCNPGFVRLKWTGPEDDGGCPIEGFTVHKNGDTNAELDTTIDSVATHLYFESTGLTCGEVNYWTVKTKNCLGVWGSDSPSLTTFTTDPPGQVEELNATHVSETELMFMWMPPDDIGSPNASHLRGYELYLDNGMGGEFHRAFDGFNMPYEESYIAGGLVLGRTYRAYVRAMGLEWPGPDSEIIYKTMSVEPGPPVDLRVESSGNKSVICSWSPPESDGGEPVLNYIVEYAPEPLFTAWTQEPYVDNTQFTVEVTGLVMGTLYQFRARAVNNAGYGEYSVIVPQIAGTPPLLAPADLSMDEATLTSIEWTWTAVSEEAAGGAPLAGYKLYMNTGRNDEPMLIYDGSERPAVTHFTATNLECGLEYIAEVSAVTRIGEGPRSKQVQFTLASAPSQPRNVQAVSSSTTAIVLEWDIPEATGCAEMYAYKIERDSGSGFEILSSGTVLAPTKTLEDSDGLVAGAAYIYRISARNVHYPQYGPTSDYITAYAAETPGPVSNVQYVSSTRTSVTLRWDPPASTGGASRRLTDSASDDGGAPIRTYVVQTDDGFGGVFRDAVVVTEPFATVENLIPGRPYRFRVSAVSAVGGGPYAPVYTQVAAALPAAPTMPLLETVAPYNDQVRVVWTEPSDNGGSPILGYKVLFDGSCTRYDGSSVASLTLADLQCVTGQQLYITVQARNTVGWSPNSVTASRACGSEPGAPQDLQLQIASPLVTLGMVDLRTPTSMVLTWKPPSDDGGVPVTRYRLYRDEGGASGRYSLAYDGSQSSTTLVNLTNGVTYRFFTTAFNGVGWGERTEAFVARMECAPRAPSTSPARVSSSPWSITIEWPRSSNDCGATITGYRVYRDSVLIYPVSNGFAAAPRLESDYGMPTTDSFAIAFTAKAVGRAWVVVVTDPEAVPGWDGAPTLTMTPQRAKLGTDAVGRSSCRWMGVAIDDTETMVELRCCELMSEGYYAAFVYVESATGLDNDGTLSSPLRFQVPKASNEFEAGPTVSSEITEDGVVVNFMAKGSAGYAWVMIVPAMYADEVSIRSFKAFEDAVGSGTCQATMFVNQLENSVNLTGCDMNTTSSYKLFVYLEDLQGRDDGSLPSPLTIQVEAVVVEETPEPIDLNLIPASERSNTFASTPDLEDGQEVTRDGITLTFRSSNAGAMWVVAVPQDEGECMSIGTVKMLTGALCQVYDVPITAVTQTVTLSNCGFVGGKSYSAFVYIEDAYGLDDGTLSLPVTFTPPRSNGFTGSGIAVVDGTITPNGLTVEITPSIDDGSRWAMVVALRHATYVDARSLKAGTYSIGGPNCWQDGVDIAALSETFILSDCALMRGTTYKVFAYVEGSNATESDGTVSTPVDITVAAKSVFITQGPSLTRTPLTDRLGFSFVSASGDTPDSQIAAAYWVVVVSEADASSIAPYNIKTTDLALGGSDCRIQGQSMQTLEEQVVELSDCQLTHSTSYSIVVYAEDMSASKDGDLQVLKVTTPELGRSNTFDALPEVVMPVTAHTVDVNFSVATSGMLWATVVLGDTCGSVAAVMSGTGAICSLANLSISEGNGDANITGCKIEAGRVHGVCVYISNYTDMLGTLADAVTFMLTPSNTFEQEPHLTQAVTTSLVEISYTPTYTGEAWVTVLNQTEPDGISVVVAKSGGAEEGLCHLGPFSVTSMQAHVLDVSSCGFAPTDPRTPMPYELYVYLENLDDADDGLISAPLPIAIPTSNAFIMEPYVTAVGTNGSGVAFLFEAAKDGMVWAAIFSVEDAPQATIADVKQTNQATLSYAGGSSCYESGSITAGPRDQPLTLTSCSLVLGSSYALVVYVEDGSGANDGALSLPTTVEVPPSNSFVESPMLTASAVAEGVSFEFRAATSTGQAWAQIFDSESTENISEDNLRSEVCTTPDGGESLCSGTCMKSDVIGDVVNYWDLTGCDLQPGMAYTLALYIEDGDQDRYGSLATLTFTVALNTSNYFEQTPRIVDSTLTKSSMQVTFRGHATAGLLWSVLLENNGASIDLTSIKRGTGSLGASTCKPAEMAIDNSFRTLSLTDCNLAEGHTFRLVMYIEDITIVDGTGLWYVLPVTIPAVETTQDALDRSYADDDVTAGQAHVYNVRAVNSVGSGIPSDASPPFLAAGPPAAPGVPVVDARSVTSINLVWSPPSTMGAEILQYRLFMSGPVELFEEDFNEIYNGPDTFFTKSFLLTGFTYRFKVRVVNIIGEGPDSAVREAASCVPPAAPATVLVSQRSTTTIVIQWDAPDPDGGCPVTSYVVRMDGAEQAAQSEQAFITADGAVTLGPTYEFEVRAINAAGSSTWSSVLDVLAAEAPAQVQNLRIVTSTAGQITLAWDSVPDGDQGGTPLTGYRIYQTILTGPQASPGTYVLFMDISVASQSRLLSEADDTEHGSCGGNGDVASCRRLTSSFNSSQPEITIVLTAGIQVCFKVAGLNLVAETNPLNDQQPALSDAICGYSAEPPEPPANVYATRTTVGVVDLFWQPSQDDGGAAVELWEVSLSRNGGSFASIATNTFSDLDHTYSGCTEGETLIFRVRGMNAVGWGSYTSTEILCAAPPSKMDAPTRQDSSRNSITTVWTAPAVNGATITSYRLYQAAGADGSFALVYSGMDLTFQSTGLLIGTTYRFAVAAVNEAGEGDLSDSTSVVCASVPGAATDLTFVSETRTSFILKWTPPTDNGGSPILRYEVRYEDGLSATNPSVLKWQGTDAYSDVLAFPSGSSSLLEVWTYNAVNSDENEGTRSASVFWHAGVPSGAVTLRLQSTTLTSVAIEWDALSLYDTGGLPALDYQVWMDDGFGGALSGPYATTSTDYSASSLLTGFTYNFEVRVRTLKGNGEAATFAAVPGTVPGVVDDLHVSSRTGTSLTISWTEPESTGGVDITGYRVYRDNGANDSSSTNITVWDGEGLASIRSVEVEDLVIGNTYSFAIETLNEAGQSSGLSSEVEITAGTVTAKMDAPVRDDSVTPSSTSITVTWSAPAATTGAAAITKYILRYDDGDYSAFSNEKTYDNTVFSDTISITGKQGEYIRFLVLAENAVGLSEESAVLVAQVCGLADEVSSVEGSDYTDTSFVLSWTAPSSLGCTNAQLVSYEVYMQQADLNWTLAKTVGPGVISTTITGLTTGQSYEFQIRVCTAVGCTDGYPTSGFEAAAGTVPEFTDSASITLVEATFTSLALQWVVPSGLTILEYELWYDAGNFQKLTDTSINPICTTTEAACNLTSLATGVDFSFQVRARNLNGFGVKSAVFTFATSFVPGSIQNLSYVSSTSDSITVSWEKPEEQNANEAQILRYEVEYTDVTLNTAAQEVTVSGWWTYATAESLQAGNTYRFRARACNTNGCGDYTAGGGDYLDLVVGKLPEAPNTPTLVSYDDPYTDVEVAWTYDGKDNGGTDLTNFIIKVSRDGGTTYLDESITTSASITSEAVSCGTMTSPPTTIFIKVAAVSSVGEGSMSSALSWLCTYPPEQPDAPTLVSSSASSITLSFSSANLYGATLLHFLMWNDDGSPGSWISETVAETATTYTKSGLDTGTAYQFRLQVVTDAGTSNFSDAVTLYAAGTPDAPTVQVESSTYSTVVLNWTEGSSDGGSTVHTWYVYGSTSSLSSSWPALTSPTYTVTTDTKQTVDCTDTGVWGSDRTGLYIFLRVAAVNDAGIGSVSASIRWRCSPLPETPDAPTRVSGTTSSITIGYSRESLYGSVLLGYLVEYDDGAAGDFQQEVISSTTQVQYTLSGLTTGLPYRFRVSVRTEVGYSEASSIATITCGGDPDAPDAPTWSSSPNASSITFDWTFSGSNGGVSISSWNVYLSSDDSTWGSAHASVTVPTMSYTLDCTEALINGVVTDVTNSYFYVRIAAVTAATSPGDGPDSSSTRLFCALPADPPTVSDLSGTEDSITFNWTYDSDAVYSSLVSYKIYINDGLSSSPALLTTITDTNDQEHTVTGLTTGRTYEVQVTIVTAVGESERSTTVELIACGTPDAPGDPALASSSCDVDSCNLTLSWTAASDNGCSLTSYSIENTTETVTAGISPYDLTGDVVDVPRGTNESYRVLAYNTRGAGTPSNFTLIEVPS